MKIEMDTTFGVVPSQDDLEWVWDDLQDGVLLQDLLLCSVLPSPQKPSAVFVETPATVNSGYGYDDVITMDMNEWYTNMEMNYGSNNTKSMEQQQHQSTSTLAINDMQNSTVEPTYNEYNYQCHQDFTQEMKSTTTTAMDYLSSASPDVAAAIVQSIPVQQPHFLPENEVTAFLNSNAPSTTNTDFDQNEMYRTGVSSVYSNSSWESFADDSSHTTELSQEEIFEEIQRECAEIERKSMSPKMQKSTSRSKKSRSSRKLDAEERKKELNRVAAAKYREKKRIERESKSVELDELESRNRKLRSQAIGLETEIKYLRDLIKEIRKRNEESS
jgi:hypothetical protein